MREITKEIKTTKTIGISCMDSIRCSRDCPYCHKEYGNYHCFIRDMDGEEIELLEDVDNSEFDTADTYGFQRTDYCLETFGK